MSFSIKKKQGDVVEIWGKGEFELKEGEVLIINLDEPTEKGEKDESDI